MKFFKNIIHLLLTSGCILFDDPNLLIISCALGGISFSVL